MLDRAARSNIRWMRFCCYARSPSSPGQLITNIARFSRLKLALLRRFRPFADGMPAHDHLGDILTTLYSEQFGRCFVP